MEKIWLKSYPKGMPSEINVKEYSSLVDLIDQSCTKYADQIAVTNMGSSLTYSELADKSNQLAAYLQQDLGLKKGDRFAIMLPNVLQYFVALFGALKAGLVIVNINPLYTKRELVHQLNDADARSIIVLENFAHTLERALPEIKMDNIIVTPLGELFSFPKSTLINFAVKYIKRMVPSYRLPQAVSLKEALARCSSETLDAVDINLNDIAFLQYTGGTTGRAKGAVLSHGNMVANVIQSATWFHELLAAQRHVMIAPLPLYHIFSLTVCSFLMMSVGAEVVLITNPRDLPGLIKTLKTTPYSVFVGISALYNALVHDKHFRELDFSQLKLAIAGGAATSPVVAQQWHELTGQPILEGYGLTETSPIVAINPPDIDAFTGAIGLPVPSTDVDIQDDQGHSLPIGEVGELCIKGPQVMKEYWKQPEETASIFTKDGWLRTGDMVRMNDEGYIFLVDRKKDMVLVSGFNVYPNEIQNVLMSHPGILEAAVIGVPSEKTGEKVKAFIVKKDPNLTEEMVIAHCKENLTNYKRPKLIEFRDELPKTAVGKILHRQLRDEQRQEQLEEQQKEQSL